MSLVSPRGQAKHEKDTAIRIAEWIQLIFVTLFMVAAWVCRLEPRRRFRVSALGLIAITAIIVSRYSGRWISPPAYSVLRDWLPAALLLVPYWQVGQFFSSADRGTQYRLAAFDHRCFAVLGIVPQAISINPTLAMYLQLAYVMVYPLIPLGLVALYANGLQLHVDEYWLVVLPATYLCFTITLFVRALPPRLIPGYPTFRIPATRFGTLNREILNRASIQAITFPSAHVASAVAAALVLLRLEIWIGLIFLWIAISIAVATVVGGYHYAADVLFAAVIATVVFGINLCFW